MMQIGDIVLRHYRVVDLIHEGGQAFVTKGVDTDTQTAVAIRKLAVSPQQRNYAQEKSRFLREANLGLDHPNLLRCLEYGEEGDDAYMILPLVDGFDLGILMSRSGGRLCVDDAVRLITQIAFALGYCHGRGVVHRDVKPGNILVDPTGRAFLIDFGICSVADQPTLTQGNGFQGTKEWAAPEQLSDPACRDSRLDLYALGAVFYFTLTGHCLSQGGAPDRPRSIDPNIPAHIDVACMQLLAQRPEDRFQSTEQFIAALNGKITPVSARRFCPSCGHPVAVGRFCSSCGADFVEMGGGQIRCLACGGLVNGADACGVCRRTFGTVDHRITFTAGSLTGATFRLPEGIFEVGREHLSPRDAHISRKQLHIACVNGMAFLTDAGSANRTCVDGQPADQPVALTAGAEIVIAQNRGIYTIHNERTTP